MWHKINLMSIIEILNMKIFYSILKLFRYWTLIPNIIKNNIDFVIDKNDDVSFLTFFKELFHYYS
jgi:hypothetical protein